MNTNPKSSARLAAIQSYYSLMIDKNQKPELVLNSVLEEMNHDKTKVKKKFAEELLNFCLKEKNEIETIIKKYSDRATGIENVNPLLLSIISVGLAELLYDTKTDRPIILSEYIHITSEFFGKGETSFVNVVMDKFIKDNA